MPARSAGVLLHRRRGGSLEVLLVHPGGPFWARRDAGAWSIPKGEHEPGEDARTCALRELREEVGVEVAADALVALGEVKQKGGKRVAAWTAPGDVDPAQVRSNTFELEWPPRSGRRAEFPEIDRAEWFGVEEARARILPAQVPLLDRLQELAGGAAADDADAAGGGPAPGEGAGRAPGTAARRPV